MDAFKHTWLNLDLDGKQGKLSKLQREIASLEVKKTDIENKLESLYDQRDEVMKELNR